MKHSYSYSKLYGLWISIKGRCYNPKNSAYHNYGGRGIRVHKDWLHNFPAFHTYIENSIGFSKTLTMDRINSNKGYEPGNLRWATRKEQMFNIGKYRNKKTTSKFKGVYFHNINKKWVANITLDDTTKYLGSFPQEKDAAKCYNEAAIKYYGNFASLNSL